MTQHTHQLSKDEVGILITLFRLTDQWSTGTASDELQRSHAQVLRWHFQSLFDYYYGLAQENRAKLAATLHATTFYAEKEGLTHGQMATLQTPTDAVLWTIDAAYDVICPTLGISHLREPFVAQTS